MENRILFRYPATGSVTDTLQLTQGLELDAPKITVEYPSPSETTLGGEIYTYRKAAVRKIIPLKIDIMTTAERDALKNWFVTVARGATNTFSYINQDGDSKEFEVRIMDDVLDFGEGTIPYSVDITLLVLNEIRRWSVDTSVGFIWNISDEPEAGSGTWEVYGETPFDGQSGLWGANTFAASPSVILSGSDVDEIWVKYMTYPGAWNRFYIWDSDDDGGWGVNFETNSYAKSDYVRAIYYSSQFSKLYFSAIDTAVPSNCALYSQTGEDASPTTIANYDGGTYNYVNAIVDHDTKLFVGMNGGRVYYSTTGLTSSFSLAYDTGEDQVRALISWNNRLYIATGDTAVSGAKGKIFKSDTQAATGTYTLVLEYDGDDEGYILDFAIWDSGDGNGEQLYAVGGR
jgi:hypothetical protein